MGSGRDPQSDATSGFVPGSVPESKDGPRIGPQTGSQSASTALSPVHPHTPTVSTWVATLGRSDSRRAAAVLDLACGSGRHARYLAAHGHGASKQSIATPQRWPSHGVAPPASPRAAPIWKAPHGPMRRRGI